MREFKVTTSHKERGWEITLWSGNFGTMLPVYLRTEKKAKRLAAALEKALRPDFEWNEQQMEQLVEQFRQERGETR